MAELNTSIQHTGVVVKQEARNVWVKITQTSACSGCHAAAVCGAADSREKTIEAIDETGKLVVGDTVQIEGNYHMGLKAIALAYAVPCILIVIALLIGQNLFGLSDLDVGIGSLLLLIPYYGGLYLMRHRHRKAFVFVARTTTTSTNYKQQI